jgi:hypothetical protein
MEDEHLYSKKILRHERAKFRKTVDGRKHTEEMMKAFPYLVVYWGQGDAKKREFCDLRRAAAIVTVTMDEIFHNLEWNGGSWETEKFMIQTVPVAVWLVEIAKQRGEGG